MKNSSATELASWNVEAQPFLKSILEGVAQPVWVVDHDGFIRFANPAALCALGYDDLSELEGKPSHQTIHYRHPDGSPFPAEECPMLLPRTTGETIHSDEDWFFRRDGSMLPVSYWSAPIDMPQGRGAVVAFTDIEEKREIEQVLRDRDAILETVAQPVFVTDHEGLIRYANPAAVEALGFSDLSELAGQNGHRLVHYKRPDGSPFPIEECQFTRARSLGEPSQVGEDWFVRKDGSMVPLAYTASPIAAPEGIGMVIAFTDIRERRAAEQAARERDVAEARVAELAASEARQRAILEAALDCVISIDQAGCIRYFNPAAERTFGYRAADVIGREMAEVIVPPSLREQHRQGLARYLETGRGRVLDRRIEIVGMRADGSEFPVELTVTRVNLPEAPIFTGYVRDITERKRAEQELIAAGRRIIEAGDVARERVTRDLHDGAQQQFVNVVINLQLAQQKWGAEPDRARELLDAAVQQAKTGIDELRELAAGIHPTLLTTRGLLAAVEALADRLPVPVEVLDIPEQRFPPAVEASVYFLVSEALTNVVKHARAARAGVHVEAVAGRLTVEVSDDGVGGADPHTGGHGLAGLADRVAAIEGTFSVRSEPSVGTTLRAEIPLPE